MNTDELRRNAIEIACVFDRCAAVVKLLPMRTDPHDASKTALMVDEHRFDGDAPIETCPTSNQWFPLHENVREHLLATADWIDRYNAKARADKPIVSMGDRTAGQRPHSKTPRPTSSGTFGRVRPAPDREPPRDERDPPVLGPNPNTPRQPLGYLGSDRFTDRKG